MKLILFAALFVGWASAFDREWSDSGIRGPAYDQLLSRFEQLQRQFPSLINIVDYGRTAKGRALRMLILQKGSVERERPTLFVSGSIHGDEYLNLEDRLPEELAKKAIVPGPISDFLGKGGTLLFVPIVNPDGYETRMRYNSSGIDLNRDWKTTEYPNGFSEIETKALAEQLDQLHREQGLRYVMMLDYHCCHASLLEPLVFDTKSSLSPDIVAKYEAVETLAKKILEVEVGTTPSVLGYRPIGASKDYYFNEYRSLAFSYEGRYAHENSLLDRHVRFWEAVASWASTDHP